jgi:membrane carboxypeptidase/penicillin-binding protein
MIAATDTLPQSNFKVPEGIITRDICTVTGQLVTPDCPGHQTRREYFLEGTDPTMPCQYHRMLKLREGSREMFFQLDRRTGGLTGVNPPASPTN